MKATIEDTNELATVDGVLARIWKGRTSNDLDVTMYVTLIGVPNDTPLEKLAELEHADELRPQTVAPVELSVALHALVAAAKRQDANIVQLVQDMIRMWRDVCPECGEMFTLCDSHDGRMCTRCSDPDDVRDFMERKHHA